MKKNPSIKQQSQQSQYQASQQEQQTKSDEILTPSKSLLSTLSFFPITTSPWVSSVSFLHYLYFTIHLLNSNFTIYQRLYNQPGLIVLNDLISGFVSYVYVINVTINILSVISFFFNKADQQGLLYLLDWLGSQVYPLLTYLIQINLALAAFNLISDDGSIAFFLITLIVNLVITFFAQNYVLRKDYLCCKNVVFLMLYKTIIIIGYTINCLGQRYIGNSPTIFLIFLILHIILSGLIFLCYFMFGFNIYRHTTPRVLLIGSIIVYLSLSFTMLFDQVLRQTTLTTNNSFIVYEIIFFGFISFFSYASLETMRRNAIHKDQKNFKKKIYYIYNIMQRASQSMDDDCQIRGILRYHTKNPCQNPHCFINRHKTIYDSKKNKQLFLTKINQGRTSLTKFLLKCIYQEQLSSRPQISTQLQYIQFFYMKLKNIFSVIHLISELQQSYLTTFQKLKLQRIKKTIKQDNQKLNHQLFMGYLQVENVIKAESNFMQVQARINKFLNTNIKLWNYVTKHTINLSQMVKIVQPNFQLLQKINQNWKQLAPYFQIQRRWKFYYVCYTLYIKNQKIKTQFLQQFGTNIHEQDLFQQQSYHIDKTTQQQKLFNSQMLFQSNTCFIHIYSSQQKSLIKRVSKYFTKMFKYDQNQIIGSSIEILMPQSIKKIHQYKFLQWARQGKSNNQAMYQVKKVFPISKKGFIIPVYKFYKQVLYFDSMLNQYQLQYIAMLKKNKEDQLVAIVNQDFLIEAFSQTLAAKLKIKHQDYHLLRRLNILSFCPTLLKYTKFQDCILQGDDDFKNENKKNQNVANQLLGQKQSQRKYSKILQVKKQLTQSNCRILMPTQMKLSQQLYRKGLQRNNTPYHGIRQVSYYLKKSRCYKKFKSQIQIKKHSLTICEQEMVMSQQSTQKPIQKSNMTTYYQIYFRDMQQTTLNNRDCQDDILMFNKQVQPKKIPSQQFDSNSIKQDDIQLFLDMNKNTSSISISFTNNIFIKDDNNKPVQMISYVGKITIIVRGFFMFFMIIVAAVFLLEYYNSQLILQRGYKLSLINQFELQIFMIQNCLYGLLNDVQNPSTINQQIKNLSKQLIRLKQNYYMKKLILDKSINPPYKYKGHNSVSRVWTQYDQISLLDFLIQKVSAFQYINLSLINSSNTQFNGYINYVLPSFYEMTQKVKLNLNNGFGQEFKQTQIMLIVVYVVEIALLAVGFGLVFITLIRITNSFVALMEIFTQISQLDLKKIYKYAHYTIRLFDHLNYKQLQMSQKQVGSMQIHILENNATIKNQQKQDQQIENANLNKKVKRVQIGQQLTKIKFKSIILIIVFLSIYGISSFALNMFISTTLSSVSDYKDNGYYQLFQYIPILQISISAMHQKYLNSSNFDINKYQKVFIKLQNMKKISTIYSSESSFSIFYKQIFFQNFCLVSQMPQKLLLYPQLSLSCQNLSQNLLQHGIQSYIFSLSSDLSSIKQKLINKKILKQDHLAVKIIDYYLLNLMKVWNQQFSLILANYTFGLMVFVITLVLFHVIVYIVLVEIFLVGLLKNKFILFKLIYQNYIPDFVVTKEKIIKAKLYVEGFIQK